ncbi:type II toxin-antitoxin system VapB family antitoxin [Kiritimatiellota bacterium B12222]|nr:type II toxin-antitoxin system VapB family antitoxin [Kiritimatiellota bacterium B12222]
MNIDGDLLDRVVKITDSKTKTDAITFALKEVDRRNRLATTLAAGTGATASELKEMFDPESDPMTLRVAEGTMPYGNPSQ